MSRVFGHGQGIRLHEAQARMRRHYLRKICQGQNAELPGASRKAATVDVVEEGQGWRTPTLEYHDRTSSRHAYRQSER